MEHQPTTDPHEWDDPFSRIRLSISGSPPRVRTLREGRPPEHPSMPGGVIVEHLAREILRLAQREQELEALVDVLTDSTEEQRLTIRRQEENACLPWSELDVALAAEAEKAEEIRGLRATIGEVTQVAERRGARVDAAEAAIQTALVHVGAAIRRLPVVIGNETTRELHGDLLAAREALTGARKPEGDDLDERFRQLASKLADQAVVLAGCLNRLAALEGKA